MQMMVMDGLPDTHGLQRMHPCDIFDFRRNVSTADFQGVQGMNIMTSEIPKLSLSL